MQRRKVESGILKESVAQKGPKIDNPTEYKVLFIPVRK